MIHAISQYSELKAAVSFFEPLIAANPLLYPSVCSVVFNLLFYEAIWNGCLASTKNSRTHLGCNTKAFQACILRGLRFFRKIFLLSKKCTNCRGLRLWLYACAVIVAKRM